MIVLNILLIWLQILTVNTMMSQYEKPVSELKWRGKCSANSRVMNDCNWCRCSARAEYVCDARVCGLVDMWGHFNDAIQEHDPGMEGHGVWRTAKTACKPGVSYRREGLLCLCSDDGHWPNPVCRDVFRILYEVEISGVSEAKGQACTPLKLYLVVCNVCFCSEDGRLRPQSCTKKKCTKNDPVLRGEFSLYKDTSESTIDDTAVEIYADCEPDLNYKLGCQHCKCLRNNRLLCEKCSNGFRTSQDKSGNVSTWQSYCSRFQPGQTFSRDCNLCYCDETGFAYCTVKKCLPQIKQITGIKINNLSGVKSEAPFEEENCTPGYIYKKSCNLCYCIERDGEKIFGCTLKTCGRSYSPDTALHRDCVVGTMYELNCLICNCAEVKGVKAQMCHVNPSCKGKKALDQLRTDDLKSLHGYCEPQHKYKIDCNTCSCLSDGQTVKCTSYVCSKRPVEPVVLDIIPIHQNGPHCPKGMSYKIDCNYCFCLSNGNAICTTVNCDKTTID